MTPPAIYRIIARNESLFTDLVDSGVLGSTGLFDRGVLSPRLRELLILRTCLAANNDYEWNLHVDIKLSALMGLSDAEIADTRSDRLDSDLWTPAERVAAELADALVQHIEVDDDLFARLRMHFDEATLLEMTQLIGWYTIAAMQAALARPERDRFTAPRRFSTPARAPNVSTIGAIVTTPSPDQELWDAFVAAKRELNRRQADFRNAKNRPEILKVALADGKWEQATALSYLATFYDDSLELLPQLVGLSQTHAFALSARQAIDRIPRDRLWPLLEPLVSAELDAVDADDYRRIAELLAHIQAWPLLEQLIHRARTIDDPDMLELAEDFDRYGPTWLAKP